MTAPSIDAVSGLVAELRDEAMRLSGRSIDRGCVDSGIASDLADRAADALEAQARELAAKDARIELLRDHGSDAVELAGRILEHLGIGQDASKEPGADPRRDRIAAMVQRALATAEARITALEDAVRVKDEALSFYACNAETCDCQPGEEQSDRVLCGHRARTALSNGEPHDR